MASWNDVKAVVLKTYNARESESGDTLTIVLSLGGGTRTQIVHIGRGSNDSIGDEWVQISSPIGKVGEVNLLAAATAAFDWLCGGIVVIGDHVHLHHAAPLINLDLNELERPLSVISTAADDIEERLTGADRY